MGRRPPRPSKVVGLSGGGERKRVLFASDVGTNDVYIFGLPDMKHLGTLTGFNEPQGECSDKHGNVYIANTKSSQVLEYSHTGTLLNTYPDTYGYPVGCAINPVNGNLAVTNLQGFTGAGQVLIYASPTAVPTVRAIRANTTITSPATLRTV